MAATAAFRGMVERDPCNSESCCRAALASGAVFNDLNKSRNLVADAADGLGAGAVAGGFVSGALALAVAGVMRACDGIGRSGLRGHSHKVSATQTADRTPINNFCPALFILQPQLDSSSEARKHGLFSLPIAIRTSKKPVSNPYRRMRARLGNTAADR